MPNSGESDRLLARPEVSIGRYAGYVTEALQSLGWDHVDVIGRYSGGQTAVELSLGAPGRVRRIVNAGVMIFDNAERADHLARYTPSIAPRWDGAHLVTAWRSFRHQTLFWPWYNRTAEAIVRRDAESDPRALHTRMVDVFKVGDGYQDAYAASFRYPMSERLNRLTVPCLLTDIPATGSYPRVAAAKAAAPACQTADLAEDPARWKGMFDRFFADG